MLHTGRLRAVFQPILANQLRSRRLSIPDPDGMPRYMLGKREPSWKRFVPSLCNNVRMALWCKERPIESFRRLGSTNREPMTPVPVFLKKYVEQKPYSAWVLLFRTTKCASRTSEWCKDTDVDVAPDNSDLCPGGQSFATALISASKACASRSSLYVSTSQLPVVSYA